MRAEPGTNPPGLPAIKILPSDVILTEWPKYGLFVPPLAGTVILVPNCVQVLLEGQEKEKGGQ